MKTIYEQLLRASPAPCQPCWHGQPEWAEEMGRMGEARRWESWDHPGQSNIYPWRALWCVHELPRSKAAERCYKVAKVRKDAKAFLRRLRKGAKTIPASPIHTGGLGILLFECSARSYFL